MIDRTAVYRSVAKAALLRTGERRHARYRVDIPLRSVAAVTIDPRGDVREGG
jgi:hypothetical protein